MTYDLSNPLDIRRYNARRSLLERKGAVVELTEVTGRSGSQNRYLHVIIGAMALETGNTLEYAKEWYYKRLANPDIFVKERSDRLAGRVTVLRSSADLTKEEMSLSIDRFKAWAAERGYYLPEPGDDGLLRRIEYEMGRNQRYL